MNKYELRTIIKDLESISNNVDLISLDHEYDFNDEVHYFLTQAFDNLSEAVNVLKRLEKENSWPARQH